jgi:hypothetical protein
MASKHFDSSPHHPFASQTNNQRTFSSKPSVSRSSTKSKLQADFEPCVYSVVCGRGKNNFNRVGNRRFRILASTFAERYSVSDNKAAKSAIVSELIAAIHQAGGHFCKYESGAWFEVGNFYAREKAGALLRDLLHTQYSSSNQSKIARRRDRRRQKPNQKQPPGQKRTEFEGTGDSDDSSTTSSCWGRSKDSLGFEYWLEEPDDFYDIDVF